MSLRVRIVLGAAVICLIAVLPAQSAPRSQCQRLSGVDRAPDRHVRLVKRVTSDRLADGSRGSRLVGCVLPRGVVYTIATRASVDNPEAQEFRYMIRQVKGRIVLLDQHGSEGGYTMETRTVVWNLGSGRSYTIARTCRFKNQTCTFNSEEDIARKAIVTREGLTVAALEHGGDARPVPTILIATFASDGTPRILDAGSPAELSPSSLVLAGDIASWTHAGEPRSAHIGAAL